MNDTPTPGFDEHGNVIPRYPIQVWISRVVIGVLLIMIIALQFSGSPKIETVTHGDTTVYTSASSSLNVFFMITPVITGVLAFVYFLQRGVFRFFSAALVAITVWLAYTAFTMDTSNHNVTVTPTSMTREVGTKAAPIQHRIDFTKTAYLYIDEVPGTRGPNYELVANAATDGTETRVPIFDMMRVALPEIIETAGNNNVVVGDLVDGSGIPAALRVDAGK
ncbi:hypothetical protein ACFL2H_11220 [Planctomycetota bacterium]